MPLDQAETPLTSHLLSEAHQTESDTTERVERNKAYQVLKSTLIDIVTRLRSTPDKKIEATTLEGTIEHPGDFIREVLEIESKKSAEKRYVTRLLAEIVRHLDSFISKITINSGGKIKTKHLLFTSGHEGVFIRPVYRYKKTRQKGTERILIKYTITDCRLSTSEFLTAKGIDDTKKIENVLLQIASSLPQKIIHEGFIPSLLAKLIQDNRFNFQDLVIINMFLQDTSTYISEFNLPEEIKLILFQTIINTINKTLSTVSVNDIIPTFKKIMGNVAERKEKFLQHPLVNQLQRLHINLDLLIVIEAKYVLGLLTDESLTETLQSCSL